MAKDKDAKPAKDAKAAKKMPTPPKRGPKDGEVGVEYLAKVMDVASATVRMKLRDAGIEKGEGGAYSWPEARADKIAKQLSAGKKADDEKPAKKDEKPAKKAGKK